MLHRSNLSTLVLFCLFFPLQHLWAMKLALTNLLSDRPLSFDGSNNSHSVTMRAKARGGALCHTPLWHLLPLLSSPPAVSPAYSHPASSALTLQQSCWEGGWPNARPPWGLRAGDIWFPLYLVTAVKSLYSPYNESLSSSPVSLLLHTLPQVNLLSN